MMMRLVHYCHLALAQRRNHGRRLHHRHLRRLSGPLRYRRNRRRRRRHLDPTPQSQ